MLELAGGSDALSPAQIKNILTDTAEDMGAAGFDNASGAGFVNAELALEAVSDLVPANRLGVNINGVPRLGQLFSAQVSLQNNEGQLVNASSNTAIRLVLQTGNGTLTGTLTGMIAAGTNSVILNGLEYSQAESNVVIRAVRETGDMVLPGNSSNFMVLPRAALTFVSVNGGLNPELNEPFSVEVQVRDANGAPVNATRSTTVTLARVNGSGTLSGTLSLPLAVGANSLIFSGLTYSQVENGLSLSATASNGDSFDATTSTLITVTNLPVLLSKGSLQIQPNPHNGHFWVLVEGNLRAMPLALGVRDSQGRLVYSQISEPAAGRHEVNLQQLPAGSYILEMELGSEKIARRMIKY
ncbi:MAG: T9SS type A sorting domain-containing protein [Microscillaceae bacterium]|nr:T9SS type A sorting domain-containing protein [Microscillaceae bacterium]